MFTFLDLFFLFEHLARFRSDESISLLAEAEHRHSRLGCFDDSFQSLCLEQSLIKLKYYILPQHTLELFLNQNPAPLSILKEIYTHLIRKQFLEYWQSWLAHWLTVAAACSALLLNLKLDTNITHLALFKRSLYIMNNNVRTIWNGDDMSRMINYELQNLTTFSAKSRCITTNVTASWLKC